MPGEIKHRRKYDKEFTRASRLGSMALFDASTVRHVTVVMEQPVELEQFH